MNDRDFSLSSVGWGYRDIFTKTIERLFAEGYLGPEREEITRQIFSLLKCSEENLYDHVLKEFLDSLTGESAWIFDLPAIFGEIIRTGSTFSQAKMFYGIEFYRILKDGGFGDSPERVQFLLSWIKKLAKIDIELAFSFLKGYQMLLSRMQLSEIVRYIEKGIDTFRDSTRNGLRFMEGKLAVSEEAIVDLTRETRLEDVSESMERLVKMLTGRNIPLEPHSDGGNLESKSSSFICLHRWIFLPERIRRFSHQNENKKRYVLIIVVASALYRCMSFPNLHGQAGFSTIGDLPGIGPGFANRNILAIAEYARAVTYIVRQWPGATQLIQKAVEDELYPPSGTAGPEALLYTLLTAVLSVHDDGCEKSARRLATLAGESVDILQNWNNLTIDSGSLLSDLIRKYPGLSERALPAVSFLPDFFYPVETGEAGSSMSDQSVESTDTMAGDAAVGDTAIGDAALGDTEAAELLLRQCGDETQPQGDEVDEDDLQRPHPLFCYDEWSSDEWSSDEGGYLRKHCSLYEEKPDSEDSWQMPAVSFEQVDQVRRVFEALRPAASNKVKKLSDGDVINYDLLAQYLIDSRVDPAPKIDFYERFIIDRRDLSVTVLLDISGSTDEETEGQKILDIEKHAALILGQGLTSLGDRFSVCGFSSNGRMNCGYCVYKDFDEEWDQNSLGRLYAAVPSSSTRIGVALRHAGYRLGRESTRRRLIMLITDGRPMDQGYDPETRYAQHDVRMACEENRRVGIQTFCVSTMENSRVDMEIMFPEKRFVILKNIAELPRVLPRLYIRLTT